jgi:hypothetical protein
MARIVMLTKKDRFMYLTVRSWHNPCRNAFDFRDYLTEHWQIIDYKPYKLSEIRNMVKELIG